MGFNFFDLIAEFWWGKLEWDLGATRVFSWKPMPSRQNLPLKLSPSGSISKLTSTSQLSPLFVRWIGKFGSHPACEDRPLISLCFAFCRPIGFMWRLRWESRRRARRHCAFNKFQVSFIHSSYRFAWSDFTTVKGYKRVPPSTCK